jgi:hypothetical protein
MKFVVTRSFISYYFSVLLGLLPAVVNAENSCDCQDPPGGRIRCEDNQVATCTVKEGKVYGECKIPPNSASKGMPLKAWALSEILGTKVQAADINRKKELQDVLSTGRYTNHRTGEVLRFRLPKGGEDS